jgi:hypothetical protein
MTIVIGGTNPAVTFPDGTIQNTSAIVGSSVPYSVLPTGSVLQVVNANYAVQVSNSTTTPQDTGLTATITPKFATSRILVLVDQNGLYKDASASNGGELYLLRNGTNIVHIAGRYAGDSGTSFALSIGAATTCFLDSPATTSAVTYKTQYYTNTASALVYVQVYSSVSTITLMEIA